MSAPTPYALDNTADTAAQLHGCLSAILDPVSQHRLAPLIRDGGHCLELGAGNGSMACWMADRVGPAGTVLAIDINPQHVRPHPNVTVMRHDITVGAIPADATYDVIHARLLLAHLPQRHDLLRRLATLLAPGGGLLIEEWGEFAPPGTAQVLRHPPNTSLPALYATYQQTLLEVFRRAGNDTTWCAQVAAAMTAADLADVDTAIFARSWPGGTAGTTLPCAVSAEKETALAEAGMPVQDQRRMRTLLADPGTLLLGNPIWSTVGRKPGGAA